MTTSETGETRARLEQRIADQERALQAKLEELDDLDHALAHDLRAPLRAVSGFGALLHNEHARNLDPEGRELLVRLLDGAARMTRMLERMVEVLRLGKRTLHRSQVDLGQLARDLAAGLILRHPGRAPEFEIEPGLLVNGDPELLKIVLLELLDNAVKFTGPRAYAHIHVGSCVVAGEQACFVADNGVGFAAEAAGRIFRMFQREHSTTQFPGAGMGLAAVHRIITQHQGRVWAESSEGGGSRILFTLGLDPACAG